MLAAVPPSRMIPWSRTPSARCFLRALVPLKVAMQASRAFHHRPQPQGSPYGRGADDVVSAGVAEAREGVELGHDGYPGSAALALQSSDEGSFHVRYPSLHGKTRLLQEVGEQRRGQPLLETELRVGVDLEACALQFLSQLFDLSRSLFLQCRCAHSTAPALLPGAPAGVFDIRGSEQLWRQPRHDTPRAQDCQQCSHQRSTSWA